MEAVRGRSSSQGKVQLVTKLLPADFHPYKFRSRLCTSSLRCRNHSIARCRALTTSVGLIGSRLNQRHQYLSIERHTQELFKNWVSEHDWNHRKSLDQFAINFFAGKSFASSDRDTTFRGCQRIWKLFHFIDNWIVQMFVGIWCEKNVYQL